MRGPMSLLLLIAQIGSIGVTIADSGLDGNEEIQKKPGTEYKISPSFMLPTEYLGESGISKPPNPVPVEIITPAVETGQKEKPTVDNSQAAAETQKSGGSSRVNETDITLELIPETSDLEFRHDSSVYAPESPTPDFTAQIFTLSYAGVRKPVLIVQPDVKRVKKPANDESGTEGKASGPAEMTSIPNFSIHFPLQTNSQFQIPRFNFTIPTLFLPGLVFTQNENVDKNTHELHVSIPHSDPSEYEQFPTSHIPSEFELIPHSINETQDKQQNAPQFAVAYTDSKFMEPILETIKYADSRLRDNVTEAASTKEQSPNNKFTTSNITDDSMKTVTPNNEPAHNEETNKNNPSKVIQQVIVTSSSTADDLKNPSRPVKPIEAKLEHIKQKIANMTNAGEPHIGVNEKPLLSHIITHHNENNHIPTPLLDHITTSHTSIPSFPNPISGHLRPNHTAPSRWKLPSLDRIYNRWFGTGRMDQENCSTPARTDVEEEDEQDDPTLCGSEGLCGVTCNRLGFYSGKCVDDSSSCVCLLKQRPEFGLKLEHFIDQRARSSENTHPAFGFCHNSACRVNCEIAGYVTGLCDSTCFCGMPWAEKMSDI